VEQNLDTILALSDRSYIMEKGRIVPDIPGDRVTAEAIRRHLML
jgi:branched-chain amino acid transport system ATP-binding protein